MTEASIDGEPQKSALSDEKAIDIGNIFTGALDSLLNAKNPQHQIDAATVLVFAAKKSREFANLRPLTKTEEDLLTSSLIDFTTKLDEQKGQVPSTSTPEIITPSTPDEASSPSSPPSPQK